MSRFFNIRRLLSFPKNEAKKIATNSSEFHCMETVKKFDFENYLATLFIKDDRQRRTAFALRAFNVELAQVRDLTKTDEIAQLRFQFWSDVVDEIYQNKRSEIDSSKFRNFPVAQELQKILSESDISKHWFKKSISARREKRHLSQFPFQTIDELEEYCQTTQSSIYYLLNERAVELAADPSKQTPGHRISLDHIASHFGKAQGLCNILRGIPHNAKYRRCYVPSDILAKSGCSHEDFLRGIVADNVQDAVFHLASTANHHLEKCLNLIDSTPNIGATDRHIYLAHIPVGDYLNALQQSHFNVFDSRLAKRNGFLVFKLWLNNNKKSF